MTVIELAEYLQLGRSTIYEMAQRAEIPCVKIAGRWRFRREQVDAWMLSRRPPSSLADTGDGVGRRAGDEHDPAE